MLTQATPIKNQEDEKEQAAVFAPANSEPTASSIFAPPDTDSKAGSIANKEAVALANERDIEKDGKEQEHDRHQAFRNHINKATILLFWVIAVGILCGIVTFVFHLITPDSLHYLTQIQLDKLQTMLSGAVLSSLLTGYVKRRMD
jgi:hypothetical protein